MSQLIRENSQVFKISQENKENSIINDITPEIVKNGEKIYDSPSGDENKNGTVYCKECMHYPVEPLPIFKVDINNNFIDLDGAFKDNDGRMRKQSLTTSEPAHQDPAYMPSCHHVSSSHVTVSGADVSDIPTSYAIPKLAPYEKAAVGTFVDLMITPGYPYKVRLNGSDDYLFDGKPLTLKSVGHGYGKKLNFSSDDLLNNVNYFWSDSNPPNGFALSLCIDINGEFLIKNADGHAIGRSAVTFVSDHQVVKKIRCPKGSAVELEIKVKFTCNLSIDSPRSLESADVTLEGIAIAARSKHGVVVGRIENVEVPGCGECVLVNTE